MISFFQKYRNFIVGILFLSVLALFFGVVLPRRMEDGIDRSVLGEVVSVENQRFTMRTQDGEVVEFTVDADVQIAEDQPLIGKATAFKPLSDRTLSTVVAAGDSVRVDVKNDAVQRLTTLIQEEE